METALLIIAVVVALIVLARSPMARGIGDAEAERIRSEWGGADVRHQFRPPRDHGGGLL